MYINKSALVSFKQIRKPSPRNARILKSKVWKSTRNSGIPDTGCLHGVCVFCLFFFLYTFFKQRKWQDGKEWLCLYSFTTKARRLSEDLSSTFHLDNAIYAESADETARRQAGMPSGADSGDITLHADSAKIGQGEKGQVCLYQDDI